MFRFALRLFHVLYEPFKAFLRLPVTIHEEDRLDYYNALEAWDTRQEFTPLVAFLRAQTEKTWERLLEKSRKNT